MDRRLLIFTGFFSREFFEVWLWCSMTFMVTVIVGEVVTATSLGGL